MNINWWTITVISFWICGVFATKYTEDRDTLVFPLIATILLGFIYFLSRG